MAIPRQGAGFAKASAFAKPTADKTADKPERPLAVKFGARTIGGVNVSPRQFALLLPLLYPMLFSAVPPERLPRADRPGTAWSVRVADRPLVFTAAITAPAPSGADEEARAALAELDAVVRAAGGDPAGLLRLNALVGADADVAAVEAAVARRFAETPVAFTLVRTPLATAGRRVAFEAVAPGGGAPAAGGLAGGRAAVLPAGGKVFVSGQAEKGADVAEAVRLTMAGLHRTLAHLGLGAAEVVQIKAFLAPFADHAAAVREVAASFGGGPVPPLVLVEWVSSLPAEIELIAAARNLPVPPGDQVAWLPLPWLSVSPRYCRVAHVGAGVPLIFLGGIDGEGSGDARGQMKRIFEQIGSVLYEAGSSYRNLVKATYYLGDARARGELGEIRGVYFDPTRAPSASALEVRSLGQPGRAARIDLIAFPVRF
ncbi:MAG: RidA family protein [Verrucomicrobia bacterium]|nr:RidA family protein [Verrucomicrobiota bacterium]